MYTCHQSGTSPTNETALWRYMDVAKFVSLLEEEKLVFVRTDQFEDPYEGEYSDAVIAKLSEGLPYTVTDLWRTKRREKAYVSCWHMNDYESAAMWALYSTSSCSVSIRCRYSRLKAALERSPVSIYGSKVSYRDYLTDADGMRIGMLAPLFNKRISFEHEREYRAVIWQEQMKNPDHVPDGAVIYGVPVDVSALVESIHVHPSAPSWFGDLVQKIVRRYSLATPVVRSSMYDRPLR